ncbi:hypothetical protein DFS34DRAFT_593953 [Phlyctochytrium arcticum]|nr:hypothetical protein DFS34DRAFT_593953 [Phlyctochytrium arcticum]
MSFGGFNPNRTKVQLKLAVNRLKLLQQKKTSLNQHARVEISQLLKKGKEESARVRVEHIIREDFNIEALEILELYAEMLLARFGLLESMKHCDQAISEAVNTVIYAAPRMEVKELSMVRDQLIMKFGKEFATAAMENQNDIVNSRIVHKLKVQTPDPVLVNQYLRTIAKAYNVEWEGGMNADGTYLDPIPQPTLSNVPFTYPQQYGPPATSAYPQTYPPGYPPQPNPSGSPAYNPHQTTHNPTAPADSFQSLPDFPGIPSGRPQQHQQPHQQPHYNPGGFAPPPPPSTQPEDDNTDIESLPNFDELTKRFEALKKRG